MRNYWYPGDLEGNLVSGIIDVKSSSYFSLFFPFLVRTLFSMLKLFKYIPSYEVSFCFSTVYHIFPQFSHLIDSISLINSIL